MISFYKYLHRTYEKTLKNGRRCQKEIEYLVALIPKRWKENSRIARM